MLADYFQQRDNSTGYNNQFKPLTVNTGFQNNTSGNPFGADMQSNVSKPAQFTMKADFKAFVPQTTNTTSFTPVSPITPGPSSLNKKNNMSVSANPFAFNKTECSHFVPTPQTLTAPSMSESSQFFSAESVDEETVMSFDGQILPLNTKKYKREMCKNWTEVGFCRYGHKCQYAHGREELEEIDRITEAQARLNEKYKSQNCRQFYREKLCPYGKRCHFRHEYRSFKKIHRHFYMAHLAAFGETYGDVLTAARDAPDGYDPID